MYNQKINIDLEKVRQMAAKMEEQHDNKCDIRLLDYLSENSGSAYNEIFEINGSTNGCFGILSILMLGTSEFLYNAAKSYEDNDNTIAEEVYAV